MSIDSSCSTAHNGYAMLLANKLRDYDKAEYHYNQSLTTRPNDAKIHTNYAGFLFYQKQKCDEALSHCEKACELEPNHSLARFFFHESRSIV